MARTRSGESLMSRHAPLSVAAAVEPLEPRRLLSADVGMIEERVFVRGTSHSDTITIGEAMVDGVKTVTVEMNGVSHHFDASRVKAIRVDGRGGNDVMQAD